MSATTASIDSTHPVVPREPAPELEVPLVGGGSWKLADQRPQAFTMLLFYRGLYRHLQPLSVEFASRGEPPVFPPLTGLDPWFSG